MWPVKGMEPASGPARQRKGSRWRFIRQSARRPRYLEEAIAMLQLITDRDALIEYQRDLRNLIYELLPIKVKRKIGHLGMSYEVEVHSNGNLWYTTELLGDRNPQRYWNAFGLESSDNPSNIVVEINIPISRIYRRVSGFFAKESKTNDIFLLHRGGIGGGREGIGKRAFVAWCRRKRPPKWVEVDEGEGSSAYAVLVGSLTAETFLEDLTSFVRDVFEFKRLVVSGDI